MNSSFTQKELSTHNILKSNIVNHNNTNPNGNKIPCTYNKRKSKVSIISNLGMSSR